MRPSLEQLGRYDERAHRDAWRVPSTRRPCTTSWSMASASASSSLKTLSHAMRLDHLYIDPAEQRHGIGARGAGLGLRAGRPRAVAAGTVRAEGQRRRRFYLRHGFVLTGEGDWDYRLRAPAAVGRRARRARAVAGAAGARLGGGATALLRSDLQVVWWTSGERFDGADALHRRRRRATPKAGRSSSSTCRRCRRPRGVGGARRPSAAAASSPPRSSVWKTG